MRFETEDAAERRCTGLITGISDVDPLRWPGSKWRCLMVRWDDMEVERHNRVSPWEIEPSSSVSGASLVSPSTKRSRIGFPTTQPDFPVPKDGTGISDFGESSRFQKVLQGQEILGFHTSYDGVDTQKHHPPELRRCFPGSKSSWDSRNLIGNSDISYGSVGFFGESFQFNKVLQGQETFSKLPHGRGLGGVNQVQESSVPGIIEGVRVPSYGTGWSALMQGYTTCMRPSAPFVQMSSPSSGIMFQQPNTPAPNFRAISSVNGREKLEINKRSSFDKSERYYGNFTSSSPCEHNSSGTEFQQGLASFGLSKEEDKQLGFPNLFLETQSSYRGSPELVSTCKSSCRLFGFPLTEGSPGICKEGNPTRVTSPYVPKASLLPYGEEQLQSKPQLVTKILGGSCTKASDIYSARDMLLDIAM